jgi:N6-adenosine-specific RNA methylase IME4
MEQSIKMKKYNIIYADPPWKFEHWGKTYISPRDPETHYNVMTMDKICSIPVSYVADENCLLFLWVTNPMLEKIFSVINAWGFEYKTVAFTWVKRNKIADSWFWGLGYWTRANSELCLLATKGNPKRINKGVHSIIETRIEEHSKKPDEVRTRIVQLCGDLPRIELFARQKTEGWDVWGNEVENSIELPV